MPRWLAQAAIACFSPQVGWQRSWARQTSGLAVAGAPLAGKREDRAESFTYGGLCALNPNEAKDRLVDKTLQRWRRAQLITLTREGRQVIWELTELGRQKVIHD